MKPVGRLGLILGIVPLLLGSLLLWAGMNSLRVAAESRSWPSVRGQIVEVGYRESTSRASRRTFVHYVPHWEYAYEVNRQRFTANRIRQAEGIQAHDTPETALAAANERFRVGEEVEVFYDPDDPGSALLSPGSASTEGVALFFGLGALLVVAGCVLPFVLPGRATGPKRLVCRQCQCEFEASGAEGRLCPACVEAGGAG